MSPTDDASRHTASAAGGGGGGGHSHRAATPLTHSGDAAVSAACAAVEADVLLWEQLGRHGARGEGAEVIYFGDHIHGDVVPAVQDGKWSAVSIVEELEVCVPVPSALRAGGAVVDVHTPAPADNFDAAYPATCIWGNFFEGAPGSGKRSYCCALLSRFSVLALSDLESALGALLPAS